MEMKYTQQFDLRISYMTFWCRRNQTLIFWVFLTVTVTRDILSTFGSEGREDRGVGWTYVMRRDVEEDCWYVQPRDELRPAASLTVVGHIIVLFRRPFLSRTPFPDSPVCHDTLAWVLGTGAFLPVSILWIFQMSLYTYPASRLSAIGLV